MGFPVSYTEMFFPNFFIHTFSLLGFLRNLVFLFFHFLGLSDFLETDVAWPDSNARMIDARNPSVSALFSREFLSVINFSNLDASTAAESSYAVCLYEFSREDEIRCLRNCKHIFHWGYVDHWIDMLDDYNQCLWAASSVTKFYIDYSSF